MNIKQREFGSKMFGALGNNLRLHIVEFLVQGPASVKEIAEGVGMKQSIASQHLAVLQNAGIVVCKPQGQLHYYSLRGPRIVRILQLVDEFYELHLEDMRSLWQVES